MTGGPHSDLVRQCLEEVCAALDVPVADVADVRVEVGAHPSGVSGGVVRVEARPAGGGLTASEWIELLLRHELTHHVLEHHWGMAPVLFWEGLPVHLGDAAVRWRVRGVSYGEYCRALLAADRWIPLRDLVRPSVYYARRTDWCVDLLAGGLCGWLLQNGRRDDLRALFGVWRPPTLARPVLDLTPVRSCLGLDLAALEASWCAALREQPADPELVRSLGERRPPPPRAAHCDLCMAPRDPVGPCPECGAPVVSLAVVGAGEGGEDGADRPR